MLSEEPVDGLLLLGAYREDEVADQARRRIERDLHDGAQQRLVTLGLQVRAAQAKVPGRLDQLTAELDHVWRPLAARSS